MLIKHSVLAGEILLLLENSTCSVSIIKVEKILQISKQDTHLAIARLLSEGLVDLIKVDEQHVIAIANNSEKSENNMPASLLALGQA